MSYKRLKPIKEFLEDDESSESSLKETSQNSPESSKDENDKESEKKDKSYVKSVLNKFEDHCLLLTSQNNDALKYLRGLRQSQSLPSSPLKGDDHEFFDDSCDKMLLVEHEETEYGPGLSR